MFLVSGGLAPRTVAATRPVIDPETGLELLPFVAPMTDEARLATASADDETRWMTPERSFAEYARRGVVAGTADVIILPTPYRVLRAPGPALDLTHGVRLRARGIDQRALAPALDQLRRAGVSGFDRGPELTVDISRLAGLRAEGYRLSSTNGAVAIVASDAAGAAHALRSLAQQVAHEGGRLRPILIEDSPRLDFRGLHIDVARNFHSKAELLKLVEQMSVYKLNRLHLHLGDDEGWRLEIKALPELAQVGGYRCHDPSETTCLLPQLGVGPHRDTPVNGYLSQADYSEILAAAKARHIEVIPSFDMPGHSRAAIRSMEARYRRLMFAGRRDEAELYRLVEPGDTTQYRSIQNYSDNTLNVCIPSTYRFIDTVLGEVAQLHAAAGTPLKTYHIGADETAGAWSDSPACQALMRSTGRKPAQLGALFIERVSNSLAQKGIAVAGWSDGMGHVNPRNMPAKVQSNIWSDLFTAAPAEAHRHANQGWKTVISVPNVTYFDIPYEPHPLERGYDWPSRGTDSFKVFSFMPENLAANASVMKDIRGKGPKTTDPEPLQPGRRITGLQAQLWSETVRSDSLVDYMLFPRLIALAERAWHSGAWEPQYRPGAAYAFGDRQVNEAQLLADWRGFAQRMRTHLALLEAARIAYRLAPPGARVTNGMLEANSEFPGQPIEYRVRGGAWQPYAAPVAVRGPVELRTRTMDGRRSSRTVEVGR
jgi:hexosaminidase